MTRLKIDGGPPRASVSTPASSREWRGGIGESQLDVDAPDRRDRPPAPGRVRDARAPRAGGDDDRAGGRAAVVGLHPGDPLALAPERAAVPSSICAPAARARAAKAFVAAAGGTG